MAPPRCTDPQQLSSALPLPVRVGGKASENCSGRGPQPARCCLLPGRTSSFPVPRLPLSGRTARAGGWASPSITHGYRGVSCRHHQDPSLPPEPSAFRAGEGFPGAWCPESLSAGLGLPSPGPVPPSPLASGPVRHCRDVLLYYVSPVFRKPVGWNAQWVSPTGLHSLMLFSPTLEVVLFFCALSATLSWPLLFKSPALLSHFDFQELSSPLDAS